VRGDRSIKFQNAPYQKYLKIVQNVESQKLKFTFEGYLGKSVLA
jgi:hypothetical protein